jgi:tetratricopeptide (TPR) repeat protein
MVAVAPDPGSRWIEAVFALRVNRPEEAIEALDTDRHRAADWEPVMWLVPTEAYHILGNHRRELREAQVALKRHPDLQLTHSLELLALAALGQAEPVGDLLDKSVMLPPQAGWWNYGSVAAITALEFRAHGYRDAAGAVFRRSIAWYRKRADAPDASPFDRYGLARTLYWAGQWQAARDQVTRLLAESPEDMDYLGMAGVTAAREGDRGNALRIGERLAAVTRPYPLLGHPTLWRARITALIGDREQAVTLLRQAISEGLMPLDVAQGLGYPMWLHRDIDFEALRNYLPFQAILKVREGRR